MGLEKVYSKRLSDETRAIWASAIGRHDFGRARAGLRKLALTSTFFPALAEMDRAILAEGQGTTVVRDPECWPCEEDIVSKDEIREALDGVMRKLRGE
jgi:hypothetical protein